MNASARRDEAGFSLLEVIISLAVAGLIAGATSGMMAFWNRIDARTAETQARLDEVLAAERLLRSFVTFAVPQPPQKTFGDNGQPKRSDSESVTLLTLGPASLRLDRPMPLTLRISGTDAGQELRLDWADPRTDEAESEIVLSAVKRLKFRYFERDDSRGGAWADRWNDGSMLPAAIALTIEDEALGPPLEIVVRTAGKMPAACVLLPADPSCQASGP